MGLNDRFFEEGEIATKGLEARDPRPVGTFQCLMGCQEVLGGRVRELDGSELNWIQTKISQKSFWKWILRKRNSVFVPAHWGCPNCGSRLWVMSTTPKLP